MTQFFSKRLSSLTPYTPGEQPVDKKYVKLNTNENPYPPSKKALDYAAAYTRSLNLYPDPVCGSLIRSIAASEGLTPEETIVTNGSDEILNFAFLAFCDDERPAAFADITYGFYPVFAQLNRIAYTEIPLKDDFTIDPADYYGLGKTIFIANPNAPTGIPLSTEQIESILKSNPDNVVVVDEAYVDFGAESCISLIRKYDNLLVTRTFSKSRSMAGVRLGYGFACPALIRDLNTIRYSTNPYNINNMTMSAAIGMLNDPEYTRDCIEKIIRTRQAAAASFEKLGFEVLPSGTNFLFVRHPQLDGESLYLQLKEKGVLVRHFTLERIRDFNRVTIGTDEEMNILFEKIREIMGGAGK